MKIPMVDLAAEHAEIEGEVRAGMEAVIARSAYILGDEVAQFEREFASFCRAPHAVGVGNGGDALELMLRALDVGPGHEVILPANTFIATALAVTRAGATPVLVDCDPDHHHIDLAQTAERVSPRTRALLPVHLYGQMAPMDALASLAKERGPALLEDAAQAHGALQDGKPPAAHGRAAGFSFYPSKNLGAYGDGGAIVTHDAALAARLGRLRSYGSSEKYVHDEMGVNSRLDTMQAVVLLAKLKRLALWNARRRAAAARYDEMLSGITDVVRPAVRVGNVHVWHVYVIRVPRRDEVHRRMQDQGIGTLIHYPIPIHLQKAFAHLGHRAGAFPVAEKAAQEVLSLPLYPTITEDQQAQVVDALRKVLGP